MVQTITSPTLGSTNSCELTQPRARSPAPKVNATSRVSTDSLLTTSTAPAFYPLLCLLEPPFGSIPLMVPGGLVKSSNPPTSSDATSYGSLTTQALPRSTSQNPPIIRRSTPPVAPGTSKHTAAPTRFKASYMVNHPASVATPPPPASSVAPTTHPAAVSMDNAYPFVAPAAQQPPASANPATFVAPAAQQPPATPNPVAFVASAAQQPLASANLATFVAPAAQQPPASANLATVVAPAAQQPPALANPATFVAPAAQQPRLRPTSRLLSSPLPSSSGYGQPRDFCRPRCPAAPGLAPATSAVSTALAATQALGTTALRIAMSTPRIAISTPRIAISTPRVAISTPRVAMSTPLSRIVLLP